MSKPDYPLSMPDGDDVAGLQRNINPIDVRVAAMNLLARREHTQRELRQKLQRRFADEQLVETELQKLAEEGLQSDQRFAESFARQRSGRGYGPMRVKQDMRTRGLTDGEIAQAIEAAVIDWYALASEAFYKKFGRSGVCDLKEKARRVRFMQYRGFAADHYRHLIDD